MSDRYLTLQEMKKELADIKAVLIGIGLAVVLSLTSIAWAIVTVGTP